MMKLVLALSLLLPLVLPVSSTNGLSTDPTIFGNAFNFWKKLSKGWDVRYTR